ncbi:UPF0753 protein [Devosia pacifica]|uniref:Probable inorganic carbon transporter subunit DabA n=1 Tax=Devosia pacifica TaxID=1335967 RepID=A0A918VXZ5_9HYPH|nr:DUF2309 domain-containing protein [Devosia pacifica]GHA33086.1 UPF0753 protein [Devosia pacifica]
MTMTKTHTISRHVLQQAVDEAVQRIAPLWPLSSFVAVNPFLGHTRQSLSETNAVLSRISGSSVFMDRQFYLDHLKRGEITPKDLAAALQDCRDRRKPDTPDALLAEAAKPAQHPDALPTIAELAAEVSASDWPGLMAERFGVWAGGYFDEGQALWAAPKNKSAFAAYCAYASHDLTPELLGLKGFGSFIAGAPSTAAESIAASCARLGLSEEALPSYFHQLLFSLAGWGQYARFKLWRAELGGTEDSTIVDLLAIRLLWEEAPYRQFEDEITTRWAATCAAHEAPVSISRSALIDSILHDAFEIARQHKLAAVLAAPAPTDSNDRPALHAAFCIDVRSEVFRRSLESVAPNISTLGFAGFFGMATNHRRYASDVDEHRLPVLLNPAYSSKTSGAPTDLAARYSARAKRAWGRFKLAAVSSFAFVESMGPVYAGKLVRDALGFTHSAQSQDPMPVFDPPLAPEAKISAAENVLRAMSLMSGFAPVVLLAGHGATVVNNPYESGLHCGACGGYAGDVNVRLLASLLNEPAVRKGLGERGITIDTDTVFVAALHNTTTDAITLFEDDIPGDIAKPDLSRIKSWLGTAGALARAERALRLPGAKRADDVAPRSRNWAEVRPEWALAGCRAFIAAPRSRTAGRSLDGTAFLHDYDFRQDEENDYRVLELIMTAPVVVASWISLQYYGSTVMPTVFGAGNKLLHNVTGGIGVLEGNGGLLRSGLPWQSVHDGAKTTHEPVRLSVCIEAPCSAMSAILERHEAVRALFDNRWLHLFALDETGALTRRYAGNLTWASVEFGDRTDAVEKAA